LRTLREAGNQRVAELQEQIPKETAAWLASVGSYVTSKSFSRLLREIYGAFPKFATRSVMR
jgi:hypothetical protein